MPVGDYTFDEEKGRLRVNCLGCLYGASIEDYPICMARTIDKILEIRKVTDVVLAKSREYEYDAEQVKILAEIAEIIEYVMKEKLVPQTGALSEKHRNCYPEMSSKVQRMFLDLMRSDPIGAYVEITREMRKIRTKLKKPLPKNFRECFTEYLEMLVDIRQRMDKTEMIIETKPYLAGYHLGDRTLYRQLFMASVKPNFMLTRYMITPPEGGVSVSRYKVGDTKIEIFKLPNKAEYFYYALPPEFRMPEEHYEILDAARRYMAEHRPGTVEFVRSKKMREIFFNIGRDVIRDTAAKLDEELTNKEIERLANILTRYTAGLGVLEILLSDEKIQDIFINSPVERQNIRIFHEQWQECITNLIPSMEDAEAWATRLRIQSGRPLDEANPVLDTDLTISGGSARFCLITRALSPDGLGFAIRRHRDKPWTLPLFIKNKMINPLAAGLLSFLVDGSVSMLVAGGRSSGKTSVLGALMLEILPKTRIITLEDTLELPVNQLRDLGYNIESLKSRSVITRVETEMPADEALRTALRLGDSAMIVGEVRSTEAKALWEAMRIGALSNIVAGTIHGESAFGVYDRVVNDLGVPPTSFKATDIIPICKMLRSADGLHRFRRMVEITEVRKEWEENPLKEGGFIPLMEYSGKEDTLKPSDTLINGESDVLNRIASHVKEWSGNWDVVWENIKLRGRIKETMVFISTKTKRPELLEADWVIKSNAVYHLITERVKKDIGYSDPERVYEEWLQWFKDVIKEEKS